MTEQLENLRKWFPKGATVYTILRRVSRSDMQRTIGIVSLQAYDTRDDTLKTGALAVDIRHPNYAVSEVLGLREDKNRNGVKINGCGMDMGFEIAYRLGLKLYNDGYALKHQWL